MYSVLTSADIYQNVTYSKTSSFAALFANKQNSGVLIELSSFWKKYYQIIMFVLKFIQS